MSKSTYVNKIDSITLSKFRKLKDIHINLGSRITLISGHNGVGKSTILGLIANASEYTSIENKSLFGKNFNSKFNEIFNLDLVNDYQKDYSAVLKYSYENDNVYRKCSVSRHKKDKKTIENNPKSPEYYLKIVPRNFNIETHVLDSKITHGIGANAKIPIPTLYVGMSRVVPNGEIDATFLNIINKNTNQNDFDYYFNLYTKIFKSLKPDFSETKEFQEQDVKFSQKRSLVPTFKNYSAKSMSMGQDSLSTILTAITSFKKLKDKLKADYHGGILVIDELDAGLHPYAQLQLLKVLEKTSKELDLQFICTTHSLTMIKETLKLVDYTKIKDKDNNYYNIAYLENLRNPKPMKDPTYKKIKNDMFLRNKHDIKPHETVVIYLEDAEASYILNEIIQYDNYKILSNDTFRFELIASSIPCDTLLKLPSKDSYFKTLIICPDGDVKTKENYRKIIDKNKNIIPLPTRNSPEDIISTYISGTLLEDEEHDYWKINEDAVTSQYMETIVYIDELQENLEQINKDKKQREIKKDWFNKNLDLFKSSNIMYFWIIDNLDEVTDFLINLNSSTLNLLKNSGEV